MTELTQIERLTSDIKDIKDIINELDTQIKKLQSEINSAEQENDELQSIDKNGLANYYIYKFTVNNVIREKKKKLESLEERFYILSNRYLKHAINEHTKLMSFLHTFEKTVIVDTVCPPAQTPILEEEDDTDFVTDESDTIELTCRQMQENPWKFKYGQIGPWISKHGQIVVTYKYDQPPYVISVPMNPVTLWSYMEKNKKVFPSIGTICQLPNASKAFGWIREFTAEEREQITALTTKNTVHLFYTTNCEMKKSAIYIGECAVYTIDNILQHKASDTNILPQLCIQSSIQPSEEE